MRWPEPQDTRVLDLRICETTDFSIWCRLRKCFLYFICISFVIETFRFQFCFQFVTHFCFLFFALGYSSCDSLFFALCWTHKMREGCGVHFVPGERPKWPAGQLPNCDTDPDNWDVAHGIRMENLVKTSCFYMFLSCQCLLFVACESYVTKLHALYLRFAQNMLCY